jgi:AGCS family alanine or glycine:cation symporter
MILAAFVCCFALATVLGWGLYGLRCARFLLGREFEKWFFAMQMAAAFSGAVLETGVIWILAETVNGLMAIPNLLALVLLSGEVTELTKNYRNVKLTHCTKEKEVL